PETLVLVADSEKLERVLLNLLSNAMKFVADGGHVRVTLAREGDDAVVSVEDDGPGVPVHLRQAIFERFRRGGEEMAWSFGGTGLGLGVAKELGECHLGRIEVGDGARGGARFRVTLPLVSEGIVGGVERRSDRAALDEVERQTVAELRRRSEPPLAPPAGG